MKQFLISSKYRTSGTSSGFVITSNYPYQTYREVKLIEAVIPVTYNNAAGTVTVIGTNSGTTAITIVPDKYTLAGLAAYFQAQLTAQLPGRMYTVTYTNTGFFTISSSTESFSLTFTSANAAAFGFSPGTTATAASVTSTTSAIDGLQIDSYINVCCNQVGGIDNGSIVLEATQTQGFVLESVIPCDVGVTKFRNSDDAPWVLLPGSQLPNNFYLTFTNGSIVDLNGADWAIKIWVRK